MYANTSELPTQFCDASDIPFYWLDFDDFDGAGNNCATSLDRDINSWHLLVLKTITNWFSVFQSTDAAERSLGAGVFYAIDALLTQATQVSGSGTDSDVRSIYTSDGHTTQKPSISDASIVILSVLLGLEVLGLIGLGFYITTTPTWTRTINSLSVAQLASTLEPEILPPAGCSDKEKLRKLHLLPGHIGVDVNQDPGRGGRTRRKLVLGGDEPVAV